MDDVVSLSPAMSEALALIQRLATTTVTVTVTGETGTGKDVMAHLIHDSSPRAGQPFVVFDCGAVPPNLVESELFGHERGAFTGAHADHPGAFERAEGGTLFLDEIGELPLDLQPRLLRALDNHSVRRVGGTKDRKVDVRIVAATNRDLPALVATKQFRQDLYFRLAAAIVQLPPLRHRLEDLPLLVPRLLRALGSTEVVVSEATMDALRAHNWPGNVRELKNVLACALAFVESGAPEPRHLRFVTPPPEEATTLETLPLGGYSLANIERAAIRQTLIRTRGNKVHAAKALGISASTLHVKLKRSGLKLAALGDRIRRPKLSSVGGGRPSAASLSPAPVDLPAGASPPASGSLKWAVIDAASSSRPPLQKIVEPQDGPGLGPAA